MRNWTAFFAALRAGILGPRLDQNEVEGCNALCKAFADAEWPIAWAAYGLATAYHETAGTMLPIREFGGPKYFHRMYDKDGTRPHVARELGNTEAGDGARFYGRGYVQLTGRRNYDMAGKALTLDLIAHPDLALDHDFAAAIMVRGMRDGWFTGVGCDDFLPGKGLATRIQFAKARRIINGNDKRDLIAGHALAFQSALTAGGWE